MCLKKTKGGYVCVSKAGKKLDHKPMSKKKAEKQEAAIAIAKQKGK